MPNDNLNKSAVPPIIVVLFFVEAEKSVVCDRSLHLTTQLALFYVLFCRENDCLLYLLMLILKCTPEHFYKGSKHYKL